MYLLDYTKNVRFFWRKSARRKMDKR